MMSDQRNYKLASNLVRSISVGGQDDIARNSINSHLGHRHQRRKISSNHTSRRKDRKGAASRRRSRRKHNMRCDPESNSCEQVLAEEKVFRNGDLVRSLDRRSSQRKERRKRRRKERRRRNKRKKNKELRSGDDKSREEEEEALEDSSRRKHNKQTGGETKEERRLRKEEKRRRRRERKRRKKEKKRKRERRRRKQLARTLSEVGTLSSDSRRRKREAPGCATSSSLRLVDSCSWPHCNPSCPRLQNPETGKEVDFLSLLESFGLEMGSVARALGVDRATLGAMDREDLLHRLTSYQG